MIDGFMSACGQHAVDRILTDTAAAQHNIQSY